ncbi:hypothetical protein K7X08_035852 [Anisodus acutangulus]|uniref:Uncharacterized protein n=1 Tax=Anisodus acutangulus TaxID=402998 RepID=A0A9Q1QXH8_9SOLA|nr:hypothetical protein K7X08_035852 [Anisodus acutangulus]
MEDTHSEDFGGNSVAKYDEGHVGIGTYRDHSEPSRGLSVHMEQEKLKQRVEKMEESLKVLVAYVEEEKFRKREKVMKKERTLKEKGVELIDEVPRPTSGVEKIDVPRPIAEIEKVIHVSVTEVEKTSCSS